MIQDSRAALYRKQIALLTVGKGKFDSVAFHNVFDLIVQKIHELKTKMPGLDAESDLQFVEEQRRQHEIDPDAYIDAMQDILDQQEQLQEQVKVQNTPPPPSSVQTPTPNQPAVGFPGSHTVAAAVATAPQAGLRRLLMPVLGGIAGLLSIAWLLGLGGLSCGIIRTVCYDSGWVDVDNKSTKVWSFDHGMSFAPTEVTLFFRPPGEEEVSYPVSIGLDYSGNPINIGISAQQINVHVFSGSPLRSIFNAATGQWQSFATGKYRVLAR
jgi:hypothetical protein